MHGDRVTAQAEEQRMTQRENAGVAPDEIDPERRDRETQIARQAVQGVGLDDAGERETLAPRRTAEGKQRGDRSPAQHCERPRQLFHLSPQRAGRDRGRGPKGATAER